MNSSRGSRNDRNGILATMAVMGVFTLFFFRSVLMHPGGMIYSTMSDLVGQTFGWKLFIRDVFLISGDLVLWNPHLMCGNPVLGNLNYALMFPMHLLYLLLPAGPAASWTYLLTFFLGGLAAWYYLRSIGISNWGAVLGGLAFGFGVRNLGHLTNGFVGHLETLPCLPLAFAFTARLAEHRRWFHAAALALTLAIILFSAFAQIFLYLMFILPLYLAWLIYSGEDRRPLLPVVQFTSAVVLACGLAAVHLMPALQLLSQLSRSTELSPELYRLGSLPLAHFFTLINPELLGRIVPQWSYFGSSYFWTLSFYTPILFLPLAFLSFADPAGRQHRNFFTMLLPAILLFAMGPYGPVYDFCHRFIPGVSLFREPARILFFVPLAMAVLAGFGWNALQRIHRAADPWNRRRALCLVAASVVLVALLAAGYGFYLNGSAVDAIRVTHRASAEFFGSGAGETLLINQYRTELNRLIPRTLVASLLLFTSSLALIIALLRRDSVMKDDTLKGLALLILAADLLFFGRGYLKTMDSNELFAPTNDLVQRLSGLQDSEAPFRVADLSGTLTDNLACAAGIHKVGGYDPINLLSTQRYFDAINNREGSRGTAWILRVEPGFNRRVLSLLNARYLVTRNPLEGMELVSTFDPLPVTVQNLGQVFIPGVRLYRNPEAAPRAWFVAGAAPLKPGVALGDQLEGIDPARTVLLEGGDAHQRQDNGPVDGFLEADVSEDGPNNLTVQVTAPGDGMLVISQAWSPGWHAEEEVSGEALPTYRANGMLVAVPVTKGDRKVALYYRPSGFVIGLVISSMSLLILFGLALFGWRFRRPPAKAAQRGPVEQETENNQQQFIKDTEGIGPQQVEQQQQIKGDGHGVQHF